MKMCVLLLCVVLLNACKPVSKAIANEVYGLNKTIDFKDRTAYYQYAQKHYAIDPSHFYVIDSASYFPFISEVIGSKTISYFTTFLNDSTEVAKSAHLVELPGCLARVQAEMKAMNETGNLPTIENKTFRRYLFYNAANQHRLMLSADTTKKMILVFSYKAGKVTKDDFIKAQQLVRSDNRYRLYIISIDTEAIIKQ